MMSTIPEKVDSAPIGSWIGQDFAPQTVNDGTARHQEVCAGRIHLVDEYDTRNTISRCLTPYGLGLRLYTSLGIQNGNSAIKHAQGTLYFNSKVYVSWLYR